jgi:hypothetical protein
MVLITILALGLLGFVGKLIYDVQQNKKQTPTENEHWGYSKDDFQKLAGIGVPKPDKNTEVINGYKELAEKWAKAGFPEPDVSIPVTSTKITTISTNFGSDKDPLAQIPMSRVSTEAKQKMAEIAKKDIQRQLDEQVIPDSVRESAQKELDEMNEIVMGTIGSKPKTQTDYRREHSKEFESAVRDVIITTLKEKHKKK